MMLLGKFIIQGRKFDLDKTSITENINSYGFPAGDMSSGFFGYVEVSGKSSLLALTEKFVQSVFYAGILQKTYGRSY